MRMTDTRLEDAAKNLLQNCAKLRGGERLLIVVEAAETGHYAPGLGRVVAGVATSLGADVATMEVPFQEVITHIDPRLDDAMQASDCTIFFARLGDQLRFCGLGANKRVVVSYALDEDMLASNFGWAHHGAFYALKEAIDTAMMSASEIRVTCPSGTDFHGSGATVPTEGPADVAITRFPQSVFAPVPAQGFSGRIAQRGFLTGTCSRFYKPYAAPLEGVLIVEFEANRIVGFSGSDEDVAVAERHYDRVASDFGLDRNFVHSWHVGIHPGCAYLQPAAANYERWCSGAFGNPRLLHFHTCGDYAPGEISLNVVDPTVEIDGVRVWENGRLYPERIAGGADILAGYPCAKLAFDEPAMEIGF